MIALARAWRRLRRRLWQSVQDDRNLDDEIALHLAQKADRVLFRP
jgi:hypothetical protein